MHIIHLFGFAVIVFVIITGGFLLVNISTLEKEIETEKTDTDLPKDERDKLG